MNHFRNIGSLAELKRQYRVLALANHPDRGGTTEAMQQINIEFEKLFKIWEHRTDSNASTPTGYESDYCGSSASQYRDYVYNEYRWRGNNYTGQSASDVSEIMRSWLKESYPEFTFSVRCRHYNSISISLIKADFIAFREEAGAKAYVDVNHYHIDNDKLITDRAKEVMSNVRDYVMSYNFDESDSMRDYFCTNFYLSLSIGTYKIPYSQTIQRLKSSVPEFKHKEGAAHKAIRQALGKAKFGTVNTRRYGDMNVLGETSYSENGEEHFYPLHYASPKTAQKRIDKLVAAGINCRLVCFRSSYIEFQSYDPQVTAALAKEKTEYETALADYNDKYRKTA